MNYHKNTLAAASPLVVGSGAIAHAQAYASVSGRPMALPQLLASLSGQTFRTPTSAPKPVAAESSRRTRNSFPIRERLSPFCIETTVAFPGAPRECPDVASVWQIKCNLTFTRR
jgi:hypothetical protein